MPRSTWMLKLHPGNNGNEEKEDIILIHDIHYYHGENPVMGMPCLSVRPSVSTSSNYSTDSNFTIVYLIFEVRISSKISAIGHKVTAPR